MMWNFKIDIDLNPIPAENDDGTYVTRINADDIEEIVYDYRGYGGYHNLWQIVGFIYPLVGLVCFFVPICIVTTPEDKLAIRDAQGNITGRKEIDLEYEEDEVHRAAELEYQKGLQAARDALIKMNELHKQ